ncbi:Secretory lipase [Tolypocladium capitatum]|uniref:Secretory lipase n=1 Tax=Tolypocladium capitatum TaxID=45235 RepID=A0A2K3Q6V2_9HYPO|nr:Secretory lipase [Tolypocladium capitatum]
MRPLRLLALAALASSQALLKPQPSSFNSTFTLTAAQIAAANLSAAVANNVNVAAQFERSNWATGSVRDDPFYTSLPANASSAAAGAVLKVEAWTDTSRYTVPPTLALSRIVYQSLTLNGTRVPVSAYVLWPYLPRRHRGGAGGRKTAPLVSWGHGTSGLFAECAPSHIRNLWYQFSAPYALALAGYAVVGTDYAGMGVPFFPDGGNITHQYIASPAAGNDLLYAAQAAQAAFPDRLSKEFVVMGHSQGGGAAWAAAQQQLTARVPGYLGTVAGSPVTNPIELTVALGNSLGLLLTAKSFLSVFGELSLSDMLTPAGVAAVNLLDEIQGCNSVFNTLLGDLLAADPRLALTRDEFVSSPYARLFGNLTLAGDRDFAGPMLVLQGTADQNVPEPLTTEYVNKTCAAFPHHELRYVRASAVSHTPVMYATQQIWMDWLDERFGAGVGGGHGRRRDGEGFGRHTGRCIVQEIGSDAPQPLGHYQGGLNYFLEYSLDDYQVA